MITSNEMLWSNYKQLKSLKVILLGLGQQSTALYFMSSLGEIPRADYAVFSDPGAEDPATYDYLEWLQGWQKDNKGIQPL